MKKGFTLIELLVVIAIIGILSAVVLGSLGSARQRGSDAAVRANLSNARSQAQLFYELNGDRYNGGTTATDVCSASALVSSTEGVYKFAQEAAETGGYSVNVNLGSAGSATAVTCHATPVSGSFFPLNSWAMEAPLRAVSGITNPMYCIDSLGNNAVYSGSRLAAGDATCN